MVVIVLVLIGVVVWALLRTPKASLAQCQVGHTAARPTEFEDDFDHSLARVQALRKEALIWLDTDQSRVKRALIEALLLSRNICNHTALKIADVFQRRSGEPQAFDYLDHAVRQSFKAVHEFDLLVFLALRWSDASIAMHPTLSAEEEHKSIASDVDALGMAALGKHIDAIVAVTKDMMETMQAFDRAQERDDFPLVLRGIYGKTEGWRRTHALAAGMFEYGGRMAWNKAKLLGPIASIAPDNRWAPTGIRLPSGPTTPVLSAGRSKSALYFSLWMRAFTPL
jgi:hypothetical protein